jgi:hypothetical protein
MNAESDKSSNKKWGVPSWKEAQKYEFAAKLNEAKLRWEFLRRLPAYREEWEAVMAANAKHLLRKLIDPKLHSTQLTKSQESKFSPIGGMPLWKVLPVPNIASLLSPIGTPHTNERVGEFETQILRILDSGYLLFVVDPHGSAQSQLQVIEKELSSFQKNLRDDRGSQFHRINKSSAFSRVSLLRVMDAYDQEGILSGNSLRGMKTQIGRQIFLDQKIEAAAVWHKIADGAYRRAEKIAMGSLIPLTVTELTK